MLHFRHPDLKGAYAHVAAGGQALFVRRVLHHGRPVGWLIDNDTERLYASARRLGVPAKLEQVILACLEKGASRRPQSARELGELLAACDDAGAWTEADARQFWKDAEGKSDGQPAPKDHAARALEPSGTNEGHFHPTVSRDFWARPTQPTAFSVELSKANVRG